MKRTYRNDKADGLRQSCAEDERHTTDAKSPVHLREKRRDRREESQLLDDHRSQESSRFTFDEFGVGGAALVCPGVFGRKPALLLLL